MAPPYTTKQWLLVNPPAVDGVAVVSGPDATWKLATVTLPGLEEGQILVKVRYISNDAGARGFIDRKVAPERYYVPTLPVGSAMRAGVLAEVLESRAGPSFAPGDLVMDYTFGQWSELAILSTTSTPQTVQKLAPLPNALALTHYLGAFGSNGLTAYMGLFEAVGRAGPDDTIVVSSAGGGVGSMAVQIAVRMLGARRVVGIAGTEAKCAWVRDGLGAHACVNYRSGTFAEDLERATPGEVDLYFDNVGGPVLDVVLTRMKKFGRIAVCGAVSTYDSAEPMQLRNWFEVINGRYTIRGFFMFDYMDKVPAALEELIAAGAEGKLVLDGVETIVEVGIEKQPETFMRLFSGENQGKLLTKLI